MAKLADGRIKCNICGWEGPESELTEQACPLCWLDPHDPRHPIPNDDDRVIWKCNRCGYEKVASWAWEPRCEKCGNGGSFTWLDLPEQMELGL